MPTPIVDESIRTRLPVQKEEGSGVHVESVELGGRIETDPVDFDEHMVAMIPGQKTFDVRRSHAHGARARKNDFKFLRADKLARVTSIRIHRHHGSEDD